MMRNTVSIALLLTVFLKLAASKHMVCYFTGWSTYRWGDGKYDVEDIDPFLCTHYIFAFAGIDYYGEVISLDPYNDLEENWGKGAFRRFTNLKKRNPALKTLLGVGGWNEGSQKYSNMASSSATRRRFIDTAVAMLQRHSFDGLDLDWEYPGSRDGSKPEDLTNYSLLVKELKEALQAKNLMLSAALSAGKDTIDLAYQISEVSKYLDLMNVMTYDYHGSTWESYTGANSPMYRADRDAAYDPLMNVNYSINYWIEKGAPKEKIILGVPLYGHTYSTAPLLGPEYFYQTSNAPGLAGQYTATPGTMGYNEICKMILTESGRWDVKWDDDYQEPFIISSTYKTDFISFDDLRSVTVKAKFIKDMGLGGGMVWSLDTDDFHNICHDGRYPLITAIKTNMQ